ncbi:MAG: sugar ABC transporter permease [Anaerolineae bacterium]|nr:sugar ABC transporter permease [Anaerolineae bacterium]
MLRKLQALALQLIDPLLSLAELILIPIQRVIGTNRMGYIFVLPNLVIFGVFILLPMLLNFYFGFTRGDSILPENRDWVGNQNLATLLTCEDYLNYRTCEEDLFWRSAGNTATYVVFEVMGVVLFSLITALSLNQKVRGRGFFRGVFFYPVLLSPVVVALIWKWILQHQNGVINSILVALGGEKIPFLVDPNWSFFWVVVIGIWAQMGFYTLILLAGLQAIPNEYYEAAAIDGANPWAKFWYLTLPLLMPTMTVVLVLSLIRAVQVFDTVFVLTGGGPGTATLYIIQYIYQKAFDLREYGMAASASLVLAVVLFALTMMQLLARRRENTGLETHG